MIGLVNEFLGNYDSNEEYKKYVQSGTSSVENVHGRFDYWRNLIKAAWLEFYIIDKYRSSVGNTLLLFYFVKV